VGCLGRGPAWAVSAAIGWSTEAGVWLRSRSIRPVRMFSFDTAASRATPALSSGTGRSEVEVQSPRRADCERERFEAYVGTCMRGIDHPAGRIGDDANVAYCCRAGAEEDEIPGLKWFVGGTSAPASYCAWAMRGRTMPAAPHAA
jgi:hypothetical protein